jgi:ABC-type nitrate/sulfonate/bicarbonate transport system substrate-binding protein
MGVSRRRFLKGAGAATAGLATGVITRPTMVYAQTKKDIKFTLPWVAEGSNMVAYVAKANGYWAKHGLNVEIARGFGSNAAAQAIGAGQFDFGMASAPAGILQQAKGLAIAQIACFGYDATMGIGVLTDSPIKTPKDLEGRQMASVVSSGEFPFLPAYAERAGFDLAKVQMAQVDNKVRDRLLAEKKVDAISGYASSAMPSYVATGVKARFMLFSDVGMAMYNNALMTQPGRLASEPQLCAAMADGLLSAHKFCLLEPDESLKLFFKEVPEIVLAATGREQTRVGLGIYRYQSLRAPAKTGGLGYADPKDFEAMTDLVMKYVAKEGEKRPTVDEMVTNKFAGQIKLSDAEWATAMKGMDEFKGYLS